MQFRFIQFCCLCATIIAGLYTQESTAQCILKDGRLVQPDGSPCANTIITAIPFLRIVPDARFGSMGDVGLAIEPDANSMHFNASNLAFARKDFSFGINYTPWLRALGLNDVFLSYLSAYKHIDGKQTLGGSLRFFSLGQIQYTDDQGNSLQTVNPNRFELAFAYARKMSKNFSAAITLKYIYSTLGTGISAGGDVLVPAHVFASDVSFTYRQPIKVGERESKLNLAIAATNLGSKVAYSGSSNPEYIPANLGIGAAYEYPIDDHNSINIALDVNKLMVPTPVPRTIDDGTGRLVPNPEFSADGDNIPDYKQKPVPASIFSSFADAPGGFSEELNELMYSIGFEYWYNQQFAVRFGHYNEHSTKGNRKFMTVGLGLRYNIFNINFSYLVPAAAAQRNPLDNTLRFSLIFDFGEAPDFGK